MPTRVDPKPRAPSATPIWREGGYEVRLRARPGLVCAGRRSGRAARARRGYASASGGRELLGYGQSARQRKRPSQGRGRRKKRAATGHPGYWQPFLDHQPDREFFGGKRLSCPVAGRAEGETAVDCGQRIRRNPGQEKRRRNRLRPREVNGR